MFDRLKALYDTHRISRVQIGAAVERGWITPEQAQEITG